MMHFSFGLHFWRNYFSSSDVRGVERVDGELVKAVFPHGTVEACLAVVAGFREMSAESLVEIVALLFTEVMLSYN
jgi:hypothetical protein